MTSSTLHPDRYFCPDPSQRAAARELYAFVKDLPLVCPHGHVDPSYFAEADFQFGSPTELLIVPDHYVFRMLYSQGVSLSELGIREIQTSVNSKPADLRKAW